MSLVICGAKKCYDISNGQNKIVMTQEEQNREIISFMVHLFAGIIAAWIAWNRHENSGAVVRLFVTIIAFLFGALYLIFITASIMLGSDAQKKEYLDLVALKAQEAAGS